MHYIYIYHGPYRYSFSLASDDRSYFPCGHGEHLLLPVI